MADELEVAETTEAENVQQPAGQSSAVTEKTEPAAAEHMIPKSRFDAINDELKRIKSEQAKGQKEREEAERKAAEDQGKWKELYEQSQSEVEAERTARRTLELNTMRKEVARSVGLPEKLASRLQGEDEESITADAKEILATLPKPAAPNINNGAGAGNAPKAGVMSPEEKREIAAILGVNPNYIS